MGCRIASRKVDAVDGVRERVAHVDGGCMLNAVARVQDDLGLDRGNEGVSAHGKGLHQIGCQIASRKLHAVDGVRERVALMDGSCMRNAVARFRDDLGLCRG